MNKIRIKNRIEDIYTILSKVENGLDDNMKPQTVWNLLFDAKNNLIRAQLAVDERVKK